MQAAKEGGGGPRWSHDTCILSTGAVSGTEDPSAGKTKKAQLHGAPILVGKTNKEGDSKRKERERRRGQRRERRESKQFCIAMKHCEENTTGNGSGRPLPGRF